MNKKETWKTWTCLEHKFLGKKCIRNPPHPSPPTQTLKPKYFSFFCPFWAIYKMWVCQLELYHPFLNFKATMGPWILNSKCLPYQIEHLIVPHQILLPNTIVLFIVHYLLSILNDYGCTKWRSTIPLCTPKAMSYVQWFKFFKSLIVHTSTCIP